MRTQRGTYKIRSLVSVPGGGRWWVRFVPERNLPDLSLTIRGRENGELVVSVLPVPGAVVAFMLSEQEQRRILAALGYSQETFSSISGILYETSGEDYTYRISSHAFLSGSQAHHRLREGLVVEVEYQIWKDDCVEAIPEPSSGSPLSPTT